MKNGAVDGGVYSNHGGMVRTVGAHDVILDAIIAHQVGPDEISSGRVNIAPDQIGYGQTGAIQQYGIVFSDAAATSGAYAGHVVLPGDVSQLSATAHIQQKDLDSVK